MSTHKTIHVKAQNLELAVDRYICISRMTGMHNYLPNSKQDKLHKILSGCNSIYFSFSILHCLEHTYDTNLQEIIKYWCQYDRFFF